MNPSETGIYSEPEIRGRLEGDLSAWDYHRGWLRRDIRTRSWPEALAVARRIAYLAEAAFHHPDLEVGRDRVRVLIRSHWEAGITDGDFELARAIQDAIP